METGLVEAVGTTGTILFASHLAKRTMRGQAERTVESLRFEERLLMMVRRPFQRLHLDVRRVVRVKFLFKEVRG